MEFICRISQLKDHFQCKIGKIFPLVNYCLKSYKHSAHYKLCCKDLKVNRGEISHINAYAKSKGHKKNAKSKKGQRIFTISSDLSLSKLSTHLKNTPYFSLSPHEIFKLSTHPPPPFFRQLFLIYWFFLTPKIVKCLT